MNGSPWRTPHRRSARAPARMPRGGQQPARARAASSGSARRRTASISSGHTPSSSGRPPRSKPGGGRLHQPESLGLVRSVLEQREAAVTRSATPLRGRPAAASALGAGEDRLVGQVDDPARVGDELVVGQRHRPAAQAARTAGRAAPRTSAACASPRKLSSFVQALEVDVDRREDHAEGTTRPTATAQRGAAGPARSIVQPPSATPAKTSSASAATPGSGRSPRRRRSRSARTCRCRRQQHERHPHRAAVPPRPRRQPERSPPTSTGSLTRLTKNSGIAEGSSHSGSCCGPAPRPRSSCRCSENSGSPVTAKSTAAHGTGPIAASAAQRDPLAASSRPGQPEPVEAGQHPRLRPQQAGERQQHQHERAAARPLGLQHAGPHHQRHVGDVDVAAGGEEGEVEARQQQRRGDRADQRREGDPPEPVDPRDQRQERGDGQADPDAVAAVAEQAQRGAGDDRQRVLGRRPGSPRTSASAGRAPRGPTAASSRSRSWDRSGRRGTRPAADAQQREGGLREAIGTAALPERGCPTQ